MESIFFVAGAIFGAGLMWISGRKKGSAAPEKKDEPSPRMKKQWENFTRYDGTERGQVRIDD